MNISKRLEFTYIPAEYWNEPISGFKLTIKGTNNLPTNSNFFLLWTPFNSSIKELTEQIGQVFPTIPANKLLTCKIKLAIPVDSKKKGIIDKDLFFIEEIVGKVIEAMNINSSQTEQHT